MTQLRVIQGGKQTHSIAQKPRLLKAYSTGNLHKGETLYHDVRFNWYCLERENPPLPYSRLIADYMRMEEKQKRFLERHVDKYFTELEIESLQKYLFEKHEMPVFVEEVATPVRERGDFFEQGSSVIYDFLELSESGDYPLPFKVWGYYTLSHCLSSQTLENGVGFLFKAFDLLKLQLYLGKEELESVVKAIHNDEGLIVVNRKQGID